MQRVTHIGVLSLAKIMGWIGLIVGAFAGVVYGSFLMLLGAGLGVNAEQGGGSITLFGIGGGLITMIAVPLAYGALSFLVGLIHGLIINVVLRLSGGLELRIEAPRQLRPTK